MRRPGACDARSMARIMRVSASALSSTSAQVQQAARSSRVASVGVGQQQRGLAAQAHSADRHPLAALAFAHFSVGA